MSLMFVWKGLMQFYPGHGSAVSLQVLESGLL